MPDPSARRPRRRTFTFLLGLGLTAALWGAATSPKYLGKPVKVYFKDKTRAPLEGIVLDEKPGEKILLKVPLGSVWHDFDKIERIEIQKEPKEVFQERV